MKFKIKCGKCGTEIKYTVGKIKQKFPKLKDSDYDENGKAEVVVNIVFDEAKCKCGHVMNIPRLK